MRFNSQNAEQLLTFQQLTFPKDDRRFSTRYRTQIVVVRFTKDSNRETRAASSKLTLYLRQILNRKELHVRVALQLGPRGTLREVVRAICAVAGVRDSVSLLRGYMASTCRLITHFNQSNITVAMCSLSYLRRIVSSQVKHAYTTTCNFSEHRHE